MRRGEGFFPVRRDRETGNLARWDDEPGAFIGGSPWQVMRRMQEDIDRLFGQFFGGGAPAGDWGSLGFGGQPGGQLNQARQVLAPSIDLSQNEREWCIEVDLPGVDRDNIDVQVQSNHLILTAELRQEEPAQAQGQQQGDRQYHRRERRYGFFQRVLPLPENVEEENISCEFRNGVLTLHVPKSARAQQQGRRIPIGEGAGATGRSSGAAAGTGTRGEVGAAAGSTGTGGAARSMGGGDGRAATEEEEERTLAGAKGGERRNAGTSGTGAAGGSAQGTTGGGGNRSRGSGK